MTRFKDNSGKWRYFNHGVELTEEEYFGRLETGKGSNADSLCPWKPLHSEAIAVHPNQIAEATAQAIEFGVPTEFDKIGRPIFTSRSHRKEYMQRYGYYDRDGGYSDAQRGGSKTDDRERLPDPGF
jgi:hypothetical protein